MCIQVNKKIVKLNLEINDDDNFKRRILRTMEVRKPIQEYTIDDLPDEILTSILSELTLEKRVQCKSLCSKWRWIIENLIHTNSLFITSNSHRSIDYHQNRLCIEHKFIESNCLLLINPIDRDRNLEFIFDDNRLLLKIRALKVDLDSQFELNELKWSTLLRLLENCRSIEHLELRVFTKQEISYLTIVNDLLIKHNQSLAHLSLKKIQYIDFLYISDLNFFQQLFTKLINLTVFECDFCFLQTIAPFELNSQSLNRKQLSKLYLPNANSISISNLIENYELKSIGLGYVDHFSLNQLLDFRKFRFLNHLEIKVREDLNSEFILNETIEQLTIHSLGIRLNVNSCIQACKAIKRLSLINCLFTRQTVDILIFNNSNSLSSLHLMNDYWDDDRQVDYLMSECFNKCSKLTEGYFKNIYLKNFYKFIYSLAVKNFQTFYSLSLDYLPDDHEFGCQTENSNSNPPFPANLNVSILHKDYNY